MSNILKSERKLGGHLALLTANLLFGLNVPIAKSVLSSEVMSPMVLNLFRMVGAASLFWLVSLFVKSERVATKDIAMLFVASLLGVQVNQMSYMFGLSMTTPIDASIISTLVPIITMVLAALYLKEPITWKKVAGVMIGASGAMLLITSSQTTISGRDSSLMGNLLCILSTVSFASYLAFCKPLINRYSPITLMKWMFLFAAICCVPVCYQDLSEVDFSAISQKVYLGTAYVVVMATFVAYVLISIGQKSLRPTLVGMYIYVQPLVASIAAITVGMDTFGWQKAIAVMLVFTGVYFVIISRARDS